MRVLHLIVFFGAQIAPCLALEIDQLELNSRFTYRYGTEANSRIAGEVELLPRLNLSFSKGFDAVVALRLRGDTDDLLMPGEPLQWSYSDASRPVPLGDQGVAELRDAYLEWRGGAASVRIGKQQIVWGSLDGIKVLDVLNPQSFEYFILEDFDQSRIPLWSVYADVSMGDWRVEAALIADDSSHYIPAEGSWYEFQAPRFRFGLEPGMSPAALRTIGAVGERGGLGLRLSRAVGNADLELVAFSGRDHEPVARSQSAAGSDVVEIVNTRRDLFGFSLQQSVASAVVRLEAGYSPDRTVTALSALGPQLREHDNWRAALGVDLNGPAGIFINLQYLHDQVRDFSHRLARDERERTVTLALRRGFFYETLQASYQLYYGIEYDDRLNRLRLDYQLGDRTTLGLAVEQFAGDQRGPFGQFANRDQVAFSITFTL